MMSNDPSTYSSQQEAPMTYTDGFVIALPEENFEAYRKMSEAAGKVWREHGALDYKECISDDLEVEGTGSFITLTDLKPGEVVVFSWILYESREERDRINAAVMKDPRMDAIMPEGAPMPFDVQRM